MKTFKTKNTHGIMCERAIVQAHIYLKITRIEVTESGIVTHGFYYHIKDGNMQLLDHIVPTLLAWEVVAQIEKQLPQLKTTSFKDNVLQRVAEFATLTLQQEGTTNYGVSPEDWEVYVEPTTQENE